MPGKTLETAEVQGLKVGAFSSEGQASVGQEVKAIRLATSTVNLASLAADTARLDTHTVTGIAVGDAVIVIPPAALEAGYDVNGAIVTAAATVKVFVENETADAVDPASADWKFLWFDLT